MPATLARSRGNSTYSGANSGGPGPCQRIITGERLNESAHWWYW